jgi:hypothetical protein
MKNILTFFLLLISFITYSQTIYQDVVYLKNGSKIKGLIIEQIPSVSLKIETTDGSVFVFKMEEIEKMTKEATQVQVEKITSNNNIQTGDGLKTGYKGIIELGYQIGVGDYGMDRLKLNFINGYQFNPNISLGFGLGLRYYEDKYYIDDNDVLFPIFTDFRVNFTDNKISPFVSAGIGYSFKSEDFDGVGFLLNPTVGVSFMVSKKSALNVSLGYELQRYASYYRSGSISAIDLNISFSF